MTTNDAQALRIMLSNATPAARKAALADLRRKADGACPSCDSTDTEDGIGLERRCCACGEQWTA